MHYVDNLAILGIVEDLLKTNDCTSFSRLTYYFKIAYSIPFRLDFDALDGFYSGIIVYL